MWFKRIWCRLFGHDWCEDMSYGSDARGVLFRCWRCRATRWRLLPTKLPKLLYAERDSHRTTCLLESPNGHRFVRFRTRDANSLDVDIVPGAKSAGWDKNGQSLDTTDFEKRAFAFIEKDQVCCACEEAPAVTEIFAMFADGLSTKPRPVCAGCAAVSNVNEEE